MKLSHKKLINLLQRAYSAEKAAAFAYKGHSSSLRNASQKKAVKQIELDERNHRKEVLAIMHMYNVPVSKYYEAKYYLIGKLIAASCYVIGWFMPIYFAGRLESGNVCEYFRMMRFFHELGIKEHDKIFYEMGIKEKKHEVYFIEIIKSSKLLPVFEKIFFWGANESLNDVDLDKKYSLESSDSYCSN